jgi:hypothetical protein
MRINTDTIYMTDNGAALCGAHLGVSAKTTGRDLSGQPSPSRLNSRTSATAPTATSHRARRAAKRRACSPMPELTDGADPAGAAVLRAAIDASGLSARRFAVEILIRDERTVRRWLTGEPMPSVVREWLARYMMEHGAG